MKLKIILCVIIILKILTLPVNSEPASDLYEQYKKSIVKITVAGRDAEGKWKHKPNKGSGFIIASHKGDAYIVTAAHVIGSSLKKYNPDWRVKPDDSIDRIIKIEIPELSKNDSWKAYVIDSNDKDDFAILRIDKDGFDAIPIIRKQAEIKQDLQKILALGYPKADKELSHIVTHGRFKQTSKGYFFHFDQAPKEGLSGGPIFNIKERKAIAILSFNESGEHFGVPILLSVPHLKPYLVKQRRDVNFITTRVKKGKIYFTITNGANSKPLNIYDIKFLTGFTGQFVYKRNKTIPLKKIDFESIKKENNTNNVALDLNLERSIFLDDETVSLNADDNATFHIPIITNSDIATGLIRIFVEYTYNDGTKEKIYSDKIYEIGIQRDIRMTDVESLLNKISPETCRAISEAEINLLTKTEKDSIKAYDRFFSVYKSRKCSPKKHIKLLESLIHFSDNAKQKDNLLTFLDRLTVKENRSEIWSILYILSQKGYEPAILSALEHIQSNFNFHTVIRRYVLKKSLFFLTRDKSLNNFGLLKHDALSNTIDSKTWSEICYHGSLKGFYSQVLDICDKAVETENYEEKYFFPAAANFSRGLALALNGHLKRAKEDFEYYLKHGKRFLFAKNVYEDWIKQLNQGINPISSKVLKELREFPLTLYATQSLSRL